MSNLGKNMQQIHVCQVAEKNVIENKCSSDY